MKDAGKKPVWVPAHSDGTYATRLVKGSATEQVTKPSGQGVNSWKSKALLRRKYISVDDYVKGILCRDTTVLARAITLMESSSREDQETAEEVLRQILPHSGRSFRIGITGAPGVGKSTFIEAFGCYLVEKGHRVAVLAVDPSSTLSQGSILGDKTRMALLSRSENAFIRPSPSGGILGGVNRKSREALLVCEAAGFDILLVETVGVGQSETMVRTITDFFLLLLLPSAGDEIQGIKRGIMEWTDLVVVNKADGQSANPARHAAAEYSRALQYLTGATEGWQTRAMTCSSKTNHGIPEIWEWMELFRQQTLESGVFERRRREQAIEWMHGLIKERLTRNFYQDPEIRRQLPLIEKAVVEGSITPTAAFQTLIAGISCKN